MSFSGVFLGGLLSSRARLRFPRHPHSATATARSSRNLQRTANRRTTRCLTKGRTPSIFAVAARTTNFNSVPHALRRGSDKLLSCADLFDERFDYLSLRMPATGNSPVESAIKLADDNVLYRSLSEMHRKPRYQSLGGSHPLALYRLIHEELGLRWCALVLSPLKMQMPGHYFWTRSQVPNPQRRRILPKEG